MSFEEERIIKVTFDNKEFKKQIADTVAALNKFNKALDIDPSYATKSLETLNKEVEQTVKQFGFADEAIYKMKASFSALQIAGYTLFSELTKGALNFGKSLYNSTIGQIKSGGLNRALNIESAKFQLQGLGIEWKKISDDIDYGVKDTAYGLDAAAKVAAQLSASQVQIGEDMKTSLRAISGVAAMTNSSYEEIGDIFTTVAGNGRLMTMELNRLSGRGLNAAAQLAKALNVTEAEVRDMTSKGKIDFQTFANAMDEAFGDHAKKANETFTGAISNMKAAMSRIGEVFQTPLNEFKRVTALQVTPIFNTIKKGMVYSVQPVLKFLLDKVSPILSRVFDKINNVVSHIVESESFLHVVYNVVMGIYSWIHQILRALYEITGFDIFNASQVHSFVEWLQKLTDWMVLTGDRGAKFREVIKGIWKAFSIVEVAVKSLIWVLQPIWQPILNFFKTLNNEYEYNNKKMESGIEKIKNVIKIVAVLMRMGIEKGIKLVGNAIKWIIFIFENFGPTILGAAAIIGKIIDKMVAFSNYIFIAGQKLTWFFNVVKKVFKTIGFGISNFIDAGGNIVEGIIIGIKDKASDLAKAMTLLAKGDVLGVFCEALGIHSPATEFIKAAANIIQGIVVGIFGNKKEADDAMSDVGTSMLSSFGDAIKSGASKMAPIVQSIRDHFSNFWAVLTDAFVIGAGIFTVAVGVAAVKAINAVINIANMLPDVAKALNNAGKGLKYQGLAEMFKTMSLTILAFGALAIVIAVISKYVDPEAFLKISLGVALLMGVQAMILKAISIFALAGAIQKAVDKLSGRMGKTQAKVNQMTEMFKNLSIMVLTVVGSIVAIYALAKYTGGYGGILKASALIVGIIVAIMGMTALMARAVGDKAFSKTSKTLSLKMNTLTNESESALGGLIGLIRTINPMIIILTASVMILSRQDLKKTAAIFGLLMGSFLIALTSMTVVMNYACRTINRATKDNDQSEIKLGAIKQFLQSITSFIRTMGLFMISFAAAAGLLSMIPQAKTEFVSKMMLTVVGLILGVIVSLMTAMAIFMAIDAKSGKMEAQMNVFSKMISKIGGAMAAMISSLSGLFIAISVSTILLSTISDPKRLEQATGAMVKILIGTGAFLLLVGVAMRSFSASLSTAKKSTSSIDAKGIETTAQQLMALFGGLQSMIMTITVALSIMAFVQKFGDINAGVKALGLVALIMTVMTGVLVMLLRTIEKNSSELKTGGVEECLKEAKSFSTITDNAGTMLLQIMGAMSTFMLTVTAVMVVLGKVLSPDELFAAVTAFTVIMAASGLIISLIVKQFTKFAKEATDAQANNFDKMIKNMAGFILAFVGSVMMLVSALGTLAIVMSNNNVSGTGIAGSILAFVVSIAGILTAIGIISKIKIDNTIKEKLAAVAVIGFTIASMMLAMAVVMKIISTIDFNTETVIASIATLVITVGLIVGGMWAITKVSASIAVATTVLYKILGVIAVCVGLTIILLNGIGAGILLIANSVKKFAETLVEIGNITSWSKVYNSILAMSACMAILGSAFKKDIDLDAVFKAAILSISLVLLVKGLSGLKGIDPANIQAFASSLNMLLDVINSNAQGIALATMIVMGIAILGGFLGIAIVILTAGILLALSMLPAIAKAMDVGFAAISKASESIAKSLEHIFAVFSATFSTIASTLDPEALTPLVEWCGMLMLAGILMLVAGVTMLIGSLTMLGAVALFGPMISLLEKVIEQADDMGTRGLERFCDTLGWLCAIGLLSVIAAVLLSIGAPGLLVGAALLLASAAILMVAGKVFEKVDKMIGNIMSTVGWIWLLSGELIGVGITLLIGSAIMSAAATMFLVASLALMGGLLALNYIFDGQLDWNNIYEGLAMFGGVIAEFIGLSTLIAAGGVAFITAAAIIMIVGVFMATAAISISAGIIALASAFLIGSLMLMAGTYLFKMAMESLSTMFDNINLEELGLAILQMIMIASAISLVGTILAIAGVPYVLGTSMVMIGSLMLYAGITMLTKAFTAGTYMKMITGIQMFINVSNKFLSAAGTFLKAGALFVGLSAMIMIGCIMIAAGAGLVAGAVALLTASVAGFVAAGNNIVAGIIQGIEDKKNDLQNAVVKLADGDVLGAFCAALGINSPARKFIEAAGNIIGGIVTGIGGDGDKVDAAITSVGNSALDKFESFTDGFQSVGASIGQAGGISLAENLTNFAGDGMTKGLSALGDFWGDGLESIFGGTTKLTINQLEGLIHSIDSAIESYGAYGHEEEKKLAMEKRAAYQAQIDELKKSNAVWDVDIASWDEFSSGLGRSGESWPTTSEETTQALAEAAATPDTGTGLAKTAGSNVGSSITNNTYNFTQNNYSPEPIDRSELYTQTQNQLDTWYKFVRDNG